MKSILIFLLSFQLIAGYTYAETALLNLDHGFTWKAMFDAGFRPTHTDDGIDKCRQLNVHVQIRKHEGGEILDLGIGDVEFSLRENHLLEFMIFYGRERRTVAEVERKSEVFARIFGDAVTQKSKIAWFETKHSVDYGGRIIDPPITTREVNDKDASNHAKMDEQSVSYYFRSGINKITPMVEHFSISPKTSLNYYVPLLKKKIQPPVGYEHISLEPNTEKPPKASNSNDSPRNSTASSRPEKIRSSTDNNSINTSSKESAPFPWWLVPTSVIFLLLALAAWLKLRKAKPTS